ncbi:MAG TPA: pectate lyase [Tepidisphaeraceae bacterium]|nr:pectate lyase [Tepidisphaeraceae bacterium]
MKFTIQSSVVALTMAFPFAAAFAQSTVPAGSTIPPGPKINSYVRRDDAFFASAEGKHIADNILNWQNSNGGWFKNYSPATTRPSNLLDDPKSGPSGDDDSVWHKTSTIDNDATYSEMRLLAHAYRVTKNEAYKDAFNRGLDYLFKAQYSNGGWPQRFPLQNNYGRHITYNDGAMLGVMELLRDVANQKPDFAFATDAQRKQCTEAFDRGVECILNCQYKQDGKLSVWCQCHDEVALQPAGARAYELPSLSGSESVGIILMLMSLPHPSQRVRDSIEGACAWFESSKILGKRIANGPGGRTMIDDPNAPPLWGRFYDLKTNKPFVCGRDGIPKATLEEIPAERRNGYSWYSSTASILPERYQMWKTTLQAK